MGGAVIAVRSVMVIAALLILLDSLHNILSREFE